MAPNKTMKIKNLTDEDYEQLMAIFQRLGVGDSNVEFSDDSMEVDEMVDCKVEKILGHRFTTGRKIQWLVKFLGYEDPEWKDDTDCDCESLIKEYLQGKMKTLYVFARVSTKNQTKDNCVSLEQQVEHVLNTIDSKQFDRVKVVKCVGSAYKRIPIDLEDLCENVSEGDLVAVYHADRFSRNIINFVKLSKNILERGANLTSTSQKIDLQSNMRDFRRAVVDSEDESMTLGRRTRETFKHLREKGYQFGKAPFGKTAVRDVNGIRKFVDHPDEIQIVKKLKNLNKKEKNIVKLRNTLNAEGVLRRGKKWTVSTVRKALYV